MKPNKKNRSKKKKKPSPPSNPNPDPNADPIHPASEPDNQIDEALALDWLQSAFASLSFDQIASAYASAGRDAFKAASILADPLLLDPAVVAEEEEPQVEIKTEIKPKEKEEEQGKRRDEERKKKRVAAVAASGIVANVIGKGYVREGNKGKKECLKGKVVQEVEREYSVEEGEEFLCAMMGEESELGMGVVKDVLGELVDWLNAYVL